MRGTKRGTLPREVFLSHSGKDRKLAEKLSQKLRAHGVPVWYSETNMLGAQQWHDEIGFALERCDWFLLILTPHSIKSEWVKRELLYALRTPRYKGRIVPMKCGNCVPARLSWTLDDFQTIDFVEDFNRGCRSLLRTWGLGFDPQK